MSVGKRHHRQKVSSSLKQYWGQHCQDFSVVEKIEAEIELYLIWLVKSLMMIMASFISRQIGRFKVQFLRLLYKWIFVRPLAQNRWLGNKIWNIIFFQQLIWIFAQKISQNWHLDQVGKLNHTKNLLPSFPAYLITSRRYHRRSCFCDLNDNQKHALEHFSGSAAHYVPPIYLLEMLMLWVFVLSRCLIDAWP